MRTSLEMGNRRNLPETLHPTPLAKSVRSARTPYRYATEFTKNGVGTPHFHLKPKGHSPDIPTEWERSV